MTKTYSLFPSSVFHQKLCSPTSFLIKSILNQVPQIEDADLDGRKWSQKNYVGGYTSFSSWSKLWMLSDDFLKLKNKIDRSAWVFAKQLEMDIHKSELQISNMWINVMPSQTTHSMHIHPLSVISGTFYIQVPKGSSPIKFEDPRSECFMGSPPRKKNAKLQNQRFVSIQPNPGDLILFESWMRHEVPAHNTSEERISISFNYDWVR